MIFENWRARVVRRQQWHRWFAWHPVALTDDPCRSVWLQPVERRINDDYPTYEYRLLPDKEEL